MAQLTRRKITFFAGTCSAAITCAWFCGSISVAAAQTQSIGTLTCRANFGVELGTNLRQLMRCNFISPWGRTRNYSALINRFDAHRVLASGKSMRWTVHGNMRTRTIVGRYVATESIGADGAGTETPDLVGDGEGGEAILLRASSSTPRRSGANLAVGVKDITIRPWSRLRKRVPDDANATGG